MKLHEKLKRLRMKNSLTQEDLANKLFVTKQAVYKWEKGTLVDNHQVVGIGHILNSQNM